MGLPLRAVAVPLVFVLCTGCGRSSVSVPEALPPSDALPSMPPPLPPDVRFEHAGYGGVGPSALPPAPNPAWTVAFLTLTAKTAMSGLRVDAVTLLDPAGVVVARAVAPIELESVPAGPLDLSAVGTPLTGSIAAGVTVRLKVRAKLDAPSEHVYKAPPGVRARIEIVDAGGGRYVLDGAAGAWPTA